MVLVLAFAPYESRPLLAAGELFRGMAIQLSYRWAAGRVMASESDRAVLLWSVCGPRPCRDAPREAAAVLVSVATGFVLFVASNALLLVVVGEALAAVGASPAVSRDLRFGMVMCRLALTLWRAVDAYRRDSGLMNALGPQSGVRWRVDVLAASPGGSGHGRALLTTFLSRADAADAEVVLHCDGRLVPFYRHHEFLIAAGGGPGSQVLMVRPASTFRPRRVRQAQRAQLQGHLRRGSAARSGTQAPTPRPPAALPRPARPTRG